MLLERLPAWATHLRSRAVLRTRPKFYFTNPSLALASLRTSPTRLLKDLALRGQLFENLVMRDLLVYAQHCDASVSFYRDNNGLDVDAIIEHADGRWIACEIKLGHDAIDAAASTLHRFENVVDTSRKGEPHALAVITATGHAHTRSDGVHVVPIGTLGV